MRGAGRMEEGQGVARVEMRGIVKRFGDVTALRGATFAARAGEIHALLGENGAGKTTLMNVLSGLYRADAGEIRLDGRPVRIAAPRDALRHHIGMVHQRPELVPHLGGLENILLGREGSRWWLRLDRHRDRVEELGHRLGLGVDLGLPVQDLAVGAQQKVEILKALHGGVRTLILDEPTTMLTPQEVDQFFGTLRALAQDGLTVIFITHKIKEVLAACDRITVLRNGSVTATVARQDASQARLVELMMGSRPVAADADPGAAPQPGSPALTVRNLGVVTAPGVRAVVECDFTLGAGELVGLAGVTGNGQRELAQALLGLRAPTEGTIELAGRNITRATIQERILQGLLYIPEDRVGEGLLPTHTVAENLYLGLQGTEPAQGPGYRPAAIRAMARSLMAQFEIAAASEQAPAGHLSGGNIQKMLVARIMTLAQRVGGRVLIAMHPTQGLDVKAAEFVRQRLLAFRSAGGGVLLISSDLDELTSLCDRILVMYRGRIVASLARREFDPLRIGHLMAGAQPGGTP